MEKSFVAICPQCGAENVHAKRCWLCMEPIEHVYPYAGPKPPIRIPAAGQSGTFSLATIMLAVTWLCVFFGMFAVGPGLAILMAILSVPVFVRTIWVVNKRRELGLDVSPGKRALLFLGSFATASIMLVVVAVAAVGTFCGVCLGLAVSGADESGAVFVSGLSAAVVVIGVGWLFVHWIRARLRRDTRR